MSPHEQGYRDFTAKGLTARCPYPADLATARERVHWLAGFEKARREALRTTEQHSPATIQEER